MKQIIVLMLVGSAISISSLAAYSQSQGKADKAPLQSNPPVGKELDQPKETTADEKAVVEGNIEFAIDLYARLAKEEKGNIIFSPYSISMALAMTYAGAKGETAEQMAKVLRFTLGQDRLHPAFAGLMNQLDVDYPGRPYQLYIANRLWGQEKLGLVDEFVQINRKDYRAGLKEVDFIEQTEDARQGINKWVEEKTKDKIKELLLPGDVTKYTRLVLTNAIYFKASWMMPFPKEQTRNAPFDLASGEKALVQMMHQNDKQFKYQEDESYQWLEMPYQENRLSMVILLPRKKEWLAHLEKTLTPAVIQQGLAGLRDQKCSVVLPRFKATLRLPLKENLEEMGMPLAFSQHADFSGIASRNNLMISDVIHKAFIDVGEEGTEAAAATGVTMRVRAGSLSVSFRADHPFLFLIKDQKTGSILFLGRVSDPRS